MHYFTIPGQVGVMYLGKKMMTHTLFYNNVDRDRTQSFFSFGLLYSRIKAYESDYRLHVLFVQFKPQPLPPFLLGGGVLIYKLSSCRILYISSLIMSNILSMTSAVLCIPSRRSNSRASFCCSRFLPSIAALCSRDSSSSSSLSSDSSGVSLLDL